MILGIETSCDDTSVALVDDQGLVHALVSQSQDLLHSQFGGVVPEIAYRNHSLVLLPLIDQVLQSSSLSWNQIERIAVTTRPGLLGSLMVGSVIAQTLGMAHKIEVVGVNHLLGHVVAPFLKDSKYFPSFSIEQEHLCLAVSGGHSSLYRVQGLQRVQILATTPDDAAGECLDKFAKMLGLGFPGGPQVDRLAQTGNPGRFQFMDHIPTSLSFSGLKSAAQRRLSGLSIPESELPDWCASFQEQLVDILLNHLRIWQQRTGLRRVTLTGGVSANSRLRQKGAQWAEENSLEFLVTPKIYCTDNAAMIAFAGLFLKKESALDCSSSSLPGDFV
ncbi:MAG: tRNA (adenosine(37)-N6)-threonylcarbamoyltransferase complex transferase subunit TsaD [Bdellovibrio sp.]